MTTPHPLYKFSLRRDPKKAFVHMVYFKELNDQLNSPPNFYTIVNEAIYESDIMYSLDMNTEVFCNHVLQILKNRYGDNFDQMVTDGDIVQLDFFDYRNSGTLIYKGKLGKVTELDQEPDDYGNLPKEYTIYNWPIKYWEDRIVHNNIINIGPEISQAFKNLNINHVHKLTYSRFKSMVSLSYDDQDNPDIYVVNFMVNGKNYYVIADFYQNIKSDESQILTEREIKTKMISRLHDNKTVYEFNPIEMDFKIHTDNCIFVHIK